jgi:hypothetical protein
MINNKEDVTKSPKANNSSGMHSNYKKEFLMVFLATKSFENLLA